MKKIMIIVIAIILIIVGVFVFKSKSNKFNYEIPKITEYNYFILKDNEKYGVIDKNGNTIIEANYTDVVIPNPEKDIFVCYDGEKSNILNVNNEKLYTEYEQVEPIKLKNVASPLCYEKSTLMYKKDGLYGLIDFNGNIITKNIYESIENLQPTEGKFLVKRENKVGVIDLKGNTIVDIKYDEILSDGYYTKEDGYQKSGFIISTTTEDGYKYGYISYKAKNILKTEYNEITRISKEDDSNIYLIASSNGQYGFYQNSKKIIDNEYQSITYDENTDLLILEKNKKYGASNISGKTIINVENDSLETRGIYIYTKKQNENKVYDIEGKDININYNKKIYETDNSEYFISTLLNNNITYYGIVNKEGTQLVNETYRYIEYLYKDYFIVSDETGNFGVINSNNKIILDIQYSSMQKIKEKNILQAINDNSTDFYSEEMKLTASVQNADIQIQEDYIIIINKDDKIYLNSNGDEIKDNSNLKNTSFLDTIGDYKKVQTTLQNIYYIKE